MPALVDRPLFTWITLEHRATLDGRITIHYEPYLVLDRIAVNAFVAQVGARKWRILETLALLSEPDPTHEHRRVVKANIPDLLAVCAGPDGGWSRSTMSSVIKSMEEDGYLVRVLGAKLGRGAGQDDTTWILADGLFALPRPAEDGQANVRATEVTSAERYESQNLEVIPPTDPLTRKDRQFSDTQNLNRHHGDGWMNTSSMDPMAQPAFMADDTTNEVLEMAVTRALRDFGWTTNIATAIRKHGLLRIAAFVVYVGNPRNRVKKPGAFVRTQLDDPHAWPEGWLPGTFVSVTDRGEITTISPTSKAQPPASPQITTAQVMEVFTALPASEQARLRAAATPHLPSDPAERAEAWRAYLIDALAMAGLLEAAS